MYNYRFYLALIPVYKLFQNIHFIYCDEANSKQNGQPKPHGEV